MSILFARFADKAVVSFVLFLSFVAAGGSALIGA